MDELDRLVAEGRAKRERAERDAAREAGSGKAERDARRIVEASLSHYAGWGWILLSIAAGIGLAMLVHPRLPASWTTEGDEGDPATLAAMATGLLPALVLRLLRPFFGARAVAAEEARVAALPFPLTGYFESLGKSPRDWTLRLTLHFQGARPSAEILGDTFRTVGAEVSLPSDTSRATASHAWEHETSPDTNGFVARYVRRTFPVLTALHARHPLARVEIEVG